MNLQEDDVASDTERDDEAFGLIKQHIKYALESLKLANDAIAAAGGDQVCSVVVDEHAAWPA